MSKNYKDIIITNLSIIAKHEDANNNKYKANAYKKVIKYLKDNNDIVISTVDDIKNIKGAGKGITEKIKELINTGIIQKIQDLPKENKKDDKDCLTEQLNNIYGVGPAKIKVLLTKINKFEDLYLKENEELLNNKQKIGLKYYNDLMLKIPHNEATKHDKIFKKELKDFEYAMVGSYRRNTKLHGDIDILIKNNPNFKLTNFIKKLNEDGYILETLANGKNKFMGICKLNDNLPARRIDILVADENYYYFALLYFTGSYEYNIYMRNLSIEKGLSLSEYGFKDLNTNELIDTSDVIKSEEDIFKYLNIEYVEPSKRL